MIPSGLKPGLIFMRLTYGLKPVPFKLGRHQETLRCAVLNPPERQKPAAGARADALWPSKG